MQALTVVRRAVRWEMKRTEGRSQVQKRGLSRSKGWYIAAGKDALTIGESLHPCELAT